VFALEELNLLRSLKQKKISYLKPKSLLGDLEVGLFGLRRVTKINKNYKYTNQRDVKTLYGILHMMMDA
jgi:hypothetical protein